MPLIADDEMYPGFGQQFGGHPQGMVVTRDAFSPPEQRRMAYDPAVPPEGLTESASPKDALPDVGWTSGPTWKSGFELDSDVLAVARILSRQRDFGDPDPNHNPLDFIRGTPLEEYRESFLTSRNLRETLSIKARLERELETRRINEASGWSGTAASLVASILSPTTLLPFGQIASGYRLGRAAMQTAARTGAWTGAAVAGQEAVLHAAQETRTLTESMMAVGGGVVLGGLLGAGISAYGSRRLARASAAIDSDIVEARRLAGVERTADPFPSFDAAGQPVPSGAAGDAGAAASRIVHENKLAPAFGLEKAFNWTNPLSRLIGSENRAARDTATRLADMPMMLDQNRLGIPTGPEGGSVESRIKIDGDLALYRMQEGLQKAFAEHRFQDPNAWFTQSRAWIEGNGSGKLSYQDFKREITRALRTETPDGGISHPIPEVQKAAEAIRKDVFNTFRDQAKRYGLFPEDTDFMAGYVMRRYDVPKILEEHGKFRDILVDWLGKGQARARREIAQLEEELRAVQGTGKEAANDIAQLKSDIEALRKRWAVDPDLLDTHLSAWRYVVQSAPKQPETLAQWIKRSGGIKDPLGELTHMLGGTREAGRIINNKTGASLDDVALRAWEQGFFGTRSERPSINELLDLIDNDVRGGSIVREADGEALQNWRIANDLRAELEASGALGTTSEAKARNVLTDWLRSQTQIARTVRREIEQDERRLAGLREQLGRAANADEQKMLQDEIENLRAQIADAQETLKSIDPPSTREDLFRLAQARRARQEAGDLRAAIQEALSFGKQITPAGTEFRVATTLKAPDGQRVDATSDMATGEIQLALSAVDPKAKIGHEALHTLVTLGHLSPEEVSTLAALAREAGTFVDEARYRQAYKERPNLDSILDEEAAASYIQARLSGVVDGPPNTVVERIRQLLERIRSALARQGFQSREDVVQAILSGEAARREARADWRRDAVQREQIVRGGDQLFALGRSGASETPEVSPDLWNIAGRLAGAHGIENAEAIAARMAGKSFDEQIDALEALLRKVDAAAQRSGRKAGKDSQKLLAQMDELRFFADAGDDELRGIAEETISKITGAPAGRMVNPFDPMFLEGKSGPLQARTLKIPDLFVSNKGHAFADFLDDDIERIASSYVRSMAPDIALAREFGDINMREAMRQIQEDADRRTAEFPDQSRKIQDEARKAQNDIIAIAKRLRGTYNLGQDPAAWSQWTARRVKEWNVLRLMGSVVAASISDPMKLLVTHGFRNNVDLFTTLATNFKGLRLARNEAKEMSAGLELVMSRSGPLWDAFDDFGGHSRFDQTMQVATKKFGRLTLMDPWNATLKQLSGAMTVNRVLRASVDLANGRISAKQRAKLAKSGIGPEMAVEIAEQYRKHGGVHGRLALANAGEWDDTDMARRAAAALRAAVRREADITIVTPGQERPLWTSGTMGSVIAQFRTFQLVSVQRTLIPAMQELDAAVVTGLAGMIALGMLSERLKAVIHGKEDKGPPKTTAEWVYAGLANSGVVGWLTDADQTMHKITRGNLSANRILAGSDRPISRFASQNVTGSMLGPSFGAAQDAMTTIGALSTQDISQADIRAVRRLLPYQNLFWLSRALRAGEQGAMDSLGIPERRAN